MSRPDEVVITSAPESRRSSPSRASSTATWGRRVVGASRFACSARPRPQDFRSRGNPVANQSILPAV